MSLITAMGAKTATAPTGSDKKLEYDDVISMLDRLGKDVRFDWYFKRGDLTENLEDIDVASLKHRMNYWLKPCGMTTYCIGEHIINKEKNIRKHIINLEYGFDGETYVPTIGCDHSFEWATIEYSLKK
jgi:hypothetical protein